LEDLDDAYAKDFDTESLKDEDAQENPNVQGQAPQL
jgi:hypothetical protein